MKLKVINSNSSGNSYILENDSEALLLECGVGIPEIKKPIDFNIYKFVGALITHNHLDHAKSCLSVMEAGIDVYASKGTFSVLKTLPHRIKLLEKMKKVKIGNFTVLPFDVKHDAVEPFGFLINHPDSGNILFLTDSYYCPYKFENLNQIIVEANYSNKILEAKMNDNNDVNIFLRNRVIQSHMSLENCIGLLEANDLTKVNNIVLIHLSDGNSDEKQFKKEVEEATGKQTFVARPNLEISFNINPF